MRSSLMSPLILSTAHLTLEPKGISITVLNSCGSLLPGVTSCQGWIMVGAAFFILVFDCRGCQYLTSSELSWARRTWRLGVPPLARYSVINDLAKKCRVFDCFGAKVRRNKELSQFPGYRPGS